MHGFKTAIPCDPERKEELFDGLKEILLDDLFADAQRSAILTSMLNMLQDNFPQLLDHVLTYLQTELMGIKPEIDSIIKKYEKKGYKYECQGQGCKAIIPPILAEYSKINYFKTLCFDCQKKEPNN